MRTRLNPEALYEDITKIPMPLVFALQPQGDVPAYLSLKMVCDLLATHKAFLPLPIQEEMGDAQPAIQLAVGIFHGSGVFPFHVMPYGLSPERGAPFDAEFNVANHNVRIGLQQHFVVGAKEMPAGAFLARYMSPLRLLRSYPSSSYI